MRVQGGGRLGGELGAGDCLSQIFSLKDVRYKRPILGRPRSSTTTCPALILSPVTFLILFLKVASQRSSSALVLSPVTFSIATHFSLRSSPARF